MSARTNLLLAILGALVVILLFIGKAGDQSDTGTGTQGQRFTMEQFDFKRFDQQGKLSYRMVSEHIEQDAATGESEIIRPVAWLYEADRPQWEITAERGWLDRQQTQLQLDQDVVIEETSQPGLRATTEILNLDLAEKQAENDSPVKITMAANRLEGIGLKAEFAIKKLTLKSNVRGLYVP